MMLAPDTQLGPYRIVEAVGAGGMGEVYRARDTKLDRTANSNIGLQVVEALEPAHDNDSPFLRSLA